MSLREVEKFTKDKEGMQNATLRRIKSMNELHPKQEFYLRKLILLFHFTTLILGSYLLYRHTFYFNPKFNPIHKPLFFFVITFTLILPISLILSFTLSLIRFIFSLICSSKSNTEVSIIPFTFTLFVIEIIACYFIGLPYSLYLIKNMIEDNVYCDVKMFLILYIFVGINCLCGIILAYVFIYMICKNGQNERNRLINLTFDNNKLENITQEVKEAMINANDTDNNKKAKED